MPEPVLLYATLDDFKDACSASELAQLTDDDPQGGEPVMDEARVKRVLAGAEARVNGYIGTRYSLPLTEVEVTDDLTHAVCIIAKYRLMRRRGISDEDLRLEYRDVIAWLQDVQAERANLFEEPDDDGRAVEVQYGTSVNTTFGPDFFPL